MNKLQYSESKTLKLTNVLKYKINLADEDFNFRAELEKMQSYIKTNGAVQIGPLIQYTNPVTVQSQAYNYSYKILMNMVGSILEVLNTFVYIIFLNFEKYVNLCSDKHKVHTGV